MRLHRLDLTRYGRFTGHSIDFGAATPGVPDFHIIYGPNESGKSTSLAALLDLFYGIEPRSVYGFLHAYTTMQIGAAIEIDRAVHDYSRIKRNQGSLLDGAGRPVPDAIILSQLGGIDRNAYKAMFSLDDETLESGGEAILESKGELGQLLFSASAGLPDLSHTLDGLRADMARFSRPGARSGILHDLKAELAQLREERAKLDTAATDYARLVESCDRHQTGYDAASAERADIRRRLDDGRRQLACLPHLTALRLARRDLAPLMALPDAPPRWAEEVPALIRQEIELATKLASAEADIARATQALADITVDETALALGARVERLSHAQARYVTAEKDLPERRLSLRQIDMNIAGILARLDQAGAPPETLLIPSCATARLRELIESWSGLATRLETAAAEHDRTVRELQAAEEKLEAAGAAITDDRATAMTVLTAVLASARSSDSTSRKRLHRRAAKARRADFEVALAALRPWSGEIAALAEMHVPGDTALWQRGLEASARDSQRHRDDVRRLSALLERQTVERDALIATTGLSDDITAGTVRAARESAWAAHRQRLDNETAQSFEEALRRDDLVAAARIGQAGDLARLGQLTQAMAVAAVEHGQAETALAEAQRRHQDILAEITQAVAAIGGGLPPAMALDALMAWLARRATALADYAAWQDAERESAEAQADEHQIKTRLAEALHAAGILVPIASELDALAALGQAALDGEAHRRMLRQQALTGRRQLQQRLEALTEAQAARDAWRDGWSRACAATWFGTSTKPPGIAVVREILVDLTKLGPLVEQRASLADRIDKMVADQAGFAEETRAVAHALGLEDSDMPVLDLAVAALARIDGARDALSRRQDRQKALAEARRRLIDIQESARLNAGRASVMLEHFGVDTLAAVEAALAHLARRTELGQRAELAAAEISATFPDLSLDAAEATLDGLDRAGLESVQKELEAQFDQIDQRTRQLFADLAKARDQVEAVGGDDAVARLEARRRTVLAEIEERALAYLRLGAGTLAAESALRLYRDRHRSAMMARASEAFRIISRNGYRGLATQPDKDGDILIGLCSDGKSKEASKMSKGTRFQLYLALRVAGYHEYVAHRPPLPFIADDIMETFDDLRAEETFRVFAELAMAGQVIYLTHHQHLCEIARGICPTVKIHTLPPPYPQA